jgi:hypothetical protein
MLTGPGGRSRTIVRAASASVGNGSASFFNPHATVGNLRVSHTECPPGYVTRITNMANSPMLGPFMGPFPCSRFSQARLSAPGHDLCPSKRTRWHKESATGDVALSGGIESVAVEGTTLPQGQ